MQILNQITNAMKDIDTLLENHLKGYTRVYRRYKPYSPTEWQTLLNNVHREFGKPGPRWQWALDHKWQKGMAEDPEWRGMVVNEWHVVFYFEKESDAVMFSLKY
jgi:hypothetical protein